MAQSVRADKGDDWGVGSGSAGLYLESALVGKSFPSPMNESEK